MAMKDDTRTTELLDQASSIRLTPGLRCENMLFYSSR